MTDGSVGTIKPTVSSYLWEVKNFCMACKSSGDLLCSPVFSTVHSSTEHKWRLNLFPKGDANELSNDHVSLYLKYMGQSDVQVNVNLSFLDDKYCKVHESDFQWLYKNESLPYGFIKFVKHTFVAKKANRVLVNDTIKILCEIIYDSSLAEPPAKKFKRNSVEQLPEYSRLEEFDEFEKLLEPGNSTTDITFKIGKDEIKVHKAIIMNRSPVFQAMFEHDMKEKKQNVVEITDIKCEVMKEVFRFIYVGKVNEVKKLADGLLVAADKYSIKGLKVLCEKQLFENLTVANTVEYLKLADMCNSCNLKSKIMTFIVQNQQDIVHKPELKLLRTELVCEVLSAVVSDNATK